mmetsp:Transcript_8516/g.24305  ORF Transcript_8516/g.24305 Transcript_8516/m.24305 type:complete len:148 (+) Transcript_8516:519-962(+)
MAVVALPLPARPVVCLSPSYAHGLSHSPRLHLSLSHHCGCVVWPPPSFSHADGQAAPSTHPSLPASMRWYHSITCQVLASVALSLHACLSVCPSACVSLCVVAVCASICLDVADALMRCIALRAIHHATYHVSQSQSSVTLCYSPTC